MSKTGLNITAFNINGDQLAKLVTFDLDSTLRTDEGRGIAARLSSKVPTKRSSKFNASLKRHLSGGVPATMLNLEAFEVGATDYIGSIKSCSIEISNPTADASGGATLDEAAVFVGGTEIKIDGTFTVPSTATLVQDFVSETDPITGLVATIVITEDGADLLEAVMICTASKHQGERGGLQMMTATWELYGAITTPTGTASLIPRAVTAAEGGSFYITTGAGAYGTSGNPLECVIDRATIDISEGQITKEDYGLTIVGLINII